MKLKFVGGPQHGFVLDSDTAPPTFGKRLGVDERYALASTIVQGEHFPAIWAIYAWPGATDVQIQAAIAEVSGA